MPALTAAIPFNKQTEVFDGDVNSNDDEEDDVQPSKAKKSKKR